MFLTPKGVPFFAGTYFPKEERFGQPPFKSVLNDVSKLYREQPDPVATATARLTEQLNNLWNRDMRGNLDANTLDTVALRVAQRFDIFFGGLTGAQKFPSVPLTEMLWRAYLRTSAQQFSRSHPSRSTTCCSRASTITSAAASIRYTTDERWLVPHFEKMTNDNAQLIDLMLLIWQHNRNVICRDPDRGDHRLADARDDGRRRVRRQPRCRFRRRRGQILSLERAEIDAALMGTFVQKFKTAYGVTRDGNFQGTQHSAAHRDRWRPTRNRKPTRRCSRSSANCCSRRG